MQVSLADIQAAKRFLSKVLEPTPLQKSQWLSDMLGCEIYLKLENMQPIGSFKIRGATYKISQLSKDQRKRGVICASAGNHAQGVAWGARLLGVRATIVMPETAPLVKIQNSIALGAEVITHGNNYDEAYEMAQKMVKKNKKTYVHAFEDPHVIAGQGTIGLELLDQLPSMDMVIGSMGGGGMMAGIAVALKEIKPNVRLFGCQAQGAPALLESIQTGHAHKSKTVNTFADGIAVKEAKSSMVKLLKGRIDHLDSADDEAIAASIVTLLEKAKVLAEGSGAIPLAIAEKNRKLLQGKKVILIISGGNIDINVVGRMIDRGLSRAGRRIRINIYISDIPGSLNRLTQKIAEQGANILQAIHDRNEVSTRLGETKVELTLETKGPDHTEKVMSALMKVGKIA